LEAVMNGRYAGYWVMTNTQQELIVRVTPDLIMQIGVTPESGWDLIEVQGMLHSLAAPGEMVDIPAAPPTAPVAVPGFCQDAASLYAGPGTHFQQVGSLLKNESLPVLGRSHDGHWLKLLYAPAAEGMAWARLSETVMTAGEPPVVAVSGDKFDLQE
jgi:hypothetical protein